MINYGYIQWYIQWWYLANGIINDVELVFLKGLLFAPGHRRRTNPCASVVPGRWVFEMGKIYFSAAWNIGKTMEKWWFIWWMGNHQLLLGGDWNHGILNDFPQSMGMSSSQLTNTPSFFTWVETNHQPAIFMGCSWLLMDLRMDFIMIRRDLTSKCTGDIHGNYHIHILWMEEILHQLVTIGQESSDDIPAGNSTWLTD